MTPEATPPRPHRRRLRRALVPAVVVAAIAAGSACASESDGAGTRVETDAPRSGDFEATAAYLQQATAQSTAEGYRLEMRFSLSGEVGEADAPLMSGEVEGDSYHYVMDLGSMLEQMADMMGESVPPELSSVDMSIEMAGDAEAIYMRAPMFAQLGNVAGMGAAAGLADMGDGWGYVDLAGVGDEVSAEVASALGAQGVDPRAVVEAVEGSDDVQDIGTAEIRGAPAHGLAAEVTMGDLLEASGQDPETLATTSGVGTDVEEAIAALYETTTPMEVWIDDDGYVRRMAFAYSTDDIAAAMGLSESEMQVLGGFEYAYAIDMFDFGAPVEFEPPADAVDITDAFLALLEA